MTAEDCMTIYTNASVSIRQHATSSLISTNISDRKSKSEIVVPESALGLRVGLLLDLLV